MGNITWSSRAHTLMMSRVSEPQLMCRNVKDDIETGAVKHHTVARIAIAAEILAEVGIVQANVKKLVDNNAQ